MLNGFGEDRADRAMQALDLLLAQAVGRCLGMEASGEQDLVYVDITQSCDDALVEEKRFELACAARQQRLQTFGGKCRFEGIDADTRVDRAGIGGIGESSELTRIDEEQRRAVV